MPADGPIVRVTRRFKAAPEPVFDAWLDPKTAGRWLFATPSGTMVKVEIDARVGGSFAIVDRRDGEDSLHSGAYLSIDRPRRLVFTFGMPKFTEDRDRITIEIAALGDGCELTLTHPMAAEWAAYVEQTEQGWARMLDGLAKSLGE